MTRCIRSISCRKKMFIEVKAPILCRRDLIWKKQSFVRFTWTTHFNRAPFWIKLIFWHILSVFRISDNWFRDILRDPIVTQYLTYFVRQIVRRKFLKHIVCLPEDNRFPCLPSPTRAVFWLDINDRL
jgi:hypothetical protein